MAAGLGTSAKERQQQVDFLDDRGQHQQVLRDVCAWLAINALRTEQLQFDLLCQQPRRGGGAPGLQPQPWNVAPQ